MEHYVKNSICRVYNKPFCGEFNERQTSLSSISSRWLGFSFFFSITRGYPSMSFKGLVFFVCVSVLVGGRRQFKVETNVRLYAPLLNYAGLIKIALA